MNWDTKLIDQLNKGTIDPSRHFKCPTSDFASNIMQLKKYYSLRQMSPHIIYDSVQNTLKHDEKLQIYSVTKTEKKTQFYFGFKTLSKPRLCTFWDKAQIKLCRGAYGDFVTMDTANGAALINVMERVMGVYMMKQQRQSEPTPLTIDEGSLISIPKDLSGRERFMSKFFVMDTMENMKNVEENDVNEPLMVTRMTLERFNELFNITPDKKVSEIHDFIVCSVFNGVEEKSKIVQPSKETQFTYSLWFTPLVFVYVENNKSE